jgi:hypothetical protein
MKLDVYYYLPAHQLRTAHCSIAGHQKAPGRYGGACKSPCPARTGVLPHAFKSEAASNID